MTTTAPAGHVGGTTPYAWPWDGVLDAAGTAVLVVTAPGTPELPAAGAAVVTALRTAGARVIGVATARPGHPPAPAPGIEVAEWVTSAGVDGFYGGGLEARLRRAGVQRLLLVGGWLETAVHSTMRSANDQGFECLLVVDGCTPGDPELVAASVSMIEMSGGIFGAVGSSAAVLAAYGGQQ